MIKGQHDRGTQKHPPASAPNASRFCMFLSDMGWKGPQLGAGSNPDPQELLKG